ncbi:MAG: hypothetical protein UU08_C0025G0002 [Candidatus Uhrbacteria bacterium GW2011_GWE2_40_58]|nr:MAG: hypothetical protein UT94_C0034G0005 [Candidatus Uhrbacteria bacterium GW2011_GWF2_40_263]KKR67141.1 MAG: hypothetical protein UU08_C0025G0002 [Candidatus Uhrbacteria bacterium GW2011_GWE2_40_58]HBK34402.1 DNA recombination protein RmuC [Candidatus Uhrbacteria bacterium]HCB55768.1 DNA recombination protein RmuC [Candidatus Uhrbacteria bacterium]
MITQTTFLIFTIVIILSSVIVFFISKHFYKKNDNCDPNSLLHSMNDLRKEIQETTNLQRKEIQDRLESMNYQLTKSVNSSSETLQKHFQHTASIVRDVTEKLTKLDETNKQVLNFSTQLQSLENILKNPKQRGILGEYWLETLLNQVLSPGQYKMQYDLGTDENTGAKLIPDAVIFVKDFIVPIDAKFSLENYNKIGQENDIVRREQLEKEFKSDVKKRIDETSKYIQTEKGTTNFAFMFVPAEGVYHNLITSNVGSVQVNTRNLIEYAFEKGVMIVSPTSFFAYLQTVILGLKALQIEDSVKEIQIQAELLMRHMRAYEEHHNRVGKHLETSVRAYAAATSELKKIDKDIYRITDGVVGKELNPVDIQEIATE